MSHIPAAFSDHLGLIVNVRVPSDISRNDTPRGKPHLKIRDEVAQDAVFQEQVAAAMVKWKEIRHAGLDILTWWELVVKPGVKNIALGRSKELNKEKRGNLICSSFSKLI